MRRAALALLFAAGCGTASQSLATPTRATDRPVGEDMLALLPAGADAVVDIDVAQLDGWPTARRLLGLLPAEGRARLERLGDDPLAQVSGVGVAFYKVARPRPRR